MNDLNFTAPPDFLRDTKHEAHAIFDAVGRTFRATVKDRDGKVVAFALHEVEQEALNAAINEAKQKYGYKAPPTSPVEELAQTVKAQGAQIATLTQAVTNLISALGGNVAPAAPAVAVPPTAPAPAPVIQTSGNLTKIDGEVDRQLGELSLSAGNPLGDEGVPSVDDEPPQLPPDFDPSSIDRPHFPNEADPSVAAPSRRGLKSAKALA